MRNKLMNGIRTIFKVLYVNTLSLAYFKRDVNPYKMETLDQLGLSMKNSCSYEGTKPIELKHWLKYLPNDNYTAIDFGSGKGLAVKVLIENKLINKVYGVEISKKLSEQSEVFLSEYIKDSHVDIINSDALNIEQGIVDQSDLFYFYNPFPDVVFSRVVDKIMASKKENNRDIVIIYFNPIYHELIKNRFEISKVIVFNNLFSKSKTNLYII